LLRAASFEVIKTFEGYNFDNVEIPPAITVEDIIATAFVKKKRKPYPIWTRGDR